MSATITSAVPEIEIRETECFIDGKWVPAASGTAPRIRARTVNADVTRRVPLIVVLLRTSVLCA